MNFNNKKKICKIFKYSNISTIAGEPIERKLYENHIPTTFIQKLFIAVTSSFSTLYNPERGDMLANLGDTIGMESLKKIHAKMCSDPIGIQILKEKPLIRKNNNKIFLNELDHFPIGTFGHAYATFMKKNSFNADERAYVKYVDDTELAYVMQRYRELHDFWHVLFNIPPTVYGEIVLKLVELSQTQHPVCALSSFIGPLRLNKDERKNLFRYHISWAYHAGKNCHPLMNVYYEKELFKPIEDVRKKLNIDIAPQLF